MVRSLVVDCLIVSCLVLGCFVIGGVGFASGAQAEPSASTSDPVVAAPSGSTVDNGAETKSSHEAEASKSFKLKPTGQTNNAPGQQSSVIKMLLGLALVIAAIFALAWLSRRLNMMPGTSQQLKIESTLSVGSKEKLLIVEVESQRLLLGVTSQQVSLLQQLSPGDSPQSQTSATANVPDHTQMDFSTRLKSVLKLKASVND